jgi:hypothetical protein
MSESTKYFNAQYISLLRIDSDRNGYESAYVAFVLFFASRQRRFGIQMQALLQNDGANDEYSDMKVANMPQNFFKLFLPEPGAFELDPSGPMNPVSIHDPQSCEIEKSISSTQASP